MSQHQSITYEIPGSGGIVMVFSWDEWQRYCQVKRELEWAAKIAHEDPFLVTGRNYSKTVTIQQDGWLTQYVPRTREDILWTITIADNGNWEMRSAGGHRER